MSKGPEVHRSIPLRPEMGADFIDTDVVVIGAGTAGCVIAARLSEVPHLRVVVVEAGPMDRNPWIHVPVGFSRLLHDDRVNWCYETVRQEALGGRQIFWPRGKVVGGSNAINGMIWVRGAPQDYDEWAEETGDLRWTWECVQSCFKSCERAPEDADERLGRHGSIALSVPNPLSDAARAFIEAGEHIGLTPRRDLSISDEPGVGEYLTTVRDGMRISSAGSHLKPALDRKNLTLLTNTLAISLEFDEDLGATGVRLRRSGKSLLLHARRGVVLCGGAVNSPQLLMLSGIGDGEHLSSLGIATRLHLPTVGRNLQDHYGTRIIARIADPITINDDFRRPWRLVKHALQYLVRRRGPLTIGGAQAGAFLSTSGPDRRPDVQVHFLPLSSRGKGWSFHKFSGVTANVCQLRPFSRGRILLRSSDPDVAPSIDPQYLSDVRDQRVLLEGLRLVRRIFAAPPLSTRFAAREEFPGPDHTGDEALLRYARNNGTTVFHPVGTCRMGKDEGAVVDTGFAVRKTKNLWVVDASVVPNIPSGNTNAVTMMLAERAGMALRGGFSRQAN